MIVRSLIGPAVLLSLVGVFVIIFEKVCRSLGFGPKSFLAAFGLKYGYWDVTSCYIIYNCQFLRTCTDRITHLDHNSYLPIPSSLLAYHQDWSDEEGKEISAEATVDGSIEPDDTNTQPCVQENETSSSWWDHVNGH